jgi:hypothetical protein
MKIGCGAVFVIKDISGHTQGYDDTEYQSQNLTGNLPSTMAVSTFGDYDSVEYSTDGGVVYNTYTDSGFFPLDNNAYTLYTRLKLGDSYTTPKAKLVSPSP